MHHLSYMCLLLADSTLIFSALVLSHFGHRFAGKPHPTWSLQKPLYQFVSPAPPPLPWHQIYVGSHSSSVYSNSMSIPHGNNFNLVPSNISQLNCCISLNWYPIPSSSIRSLSLYASIHSLVFCSVDNTSMSMISNAFVPSVGNGGRVGRFIGGCSGTGLYLCSGITTLVKCYSNSMSVYMYPHFDQGWCASSHPSPTYLIRICSFRYLYLAEFVLSLSNSWKACPAVIEQRGELYCWWRYDAFMKSSIEDFSFFSFAIFFLLRFLFLFAQSLVEVYLSSMCILSTCNDKRIGQLFWELMK